jgi:hypothetical protein
MKKLSRIYAGYGVSQTPIKIVLKKGNSIVYKKTKLYVSMCIILALCLIYWGLEIYQIRIGYTILSNQEKYLYLYKRNIGIHKIQSYLEILIMIIYVLFAFIFVIKNNNMQKFKRILISNFALILILYLVNIILLYLNKMNYNDLTFSIILLFLCPGMLIILIYSIVLLVKEQVNKS